MSLESKFSRFIRHGGSGSIVVRLDSLSTLERKFTVSPENLLGSIADNALAEGLADLNQYLPEGLSANIQGVDFSDIKSVLDARIAARVAEIGLPVDENDPVITAAIQHAAAQISARLQQDGMGVTEYIWRSQDDTRVRPLHQDHDDQFFFWSTPPDDGAPGTAFGCRCSAEPVFVLEDLPEGATCEKVTADKLSNVFPGASDERLQEFADAIDAVITIGKLDSPERLMHFLGQAGVEMGAEALTVEGFNYNPAGLRLTFRAYFAAHPDEAEELGRTDLHEADREAIANRVYGNRYGNGDEESGDGWRYRGRGMFHTTFHHNYQTLTEVHNDLFGENTDFVSHPELLERPKYAAGAAAIYWLDHELYNLADLGISEEAANSISQVINSGEDDEKRSKRWEAVEYLHDLDVFSGICRFSVTKPRFDAA